MRQTDYFRTANICACGDHGFVGLTRGKVALVSSESLPKIAGRLWYSLMASGRFYAARGTGTETILMHRYLTSAQKGEHVDHENHDGLDNRDDNLRRCSPSQNLWNALPYGAVKFKGVSVSAKKFRAAIMKNGEATALGRFDTPEEAARAYDAAAIELHGEYARTNAMLGLLPAAPSGSGATS